MYPPLCPNNSISPTVQWQKGERNHSTTETGFPYSFRLRQEPHSLPNLRHHFLTLLIESTCHQLTLDFATIKTEIFLTQLTLRCSREDLSLSLSRSELLSVCLEKYSSGLFSLHSRMVRHFTTITFS